MAKYPSSPPNPSSTLLWVRGLYCGVAGVRAETPGQSWGGSRTPPIQGILSSPNTSKCLSKSLSDNSGLSKALCKRYCHPAAETLVFGPWEGTVRDNHPLQLWSPRSHAAQDSVAPRSLPSAAGMGAPCLCHSLSPQLQGCLGSTSLKHMGNGMWFAWGQAPISMGVREISMQPCQS